MGLLRNLLSKTANSQVEKLKSIQSLHGYNPKASNYKMDTLEQIKSIPVPTSKFQYNCDFTESIEYVLQRKATQYKKEGKMDLAIECLRKSNEIMPFAPMEYSEKDYGRLESYLKQAKRFDEAREAKVKNSEKLDKHQTENRTFRKKVTTDMSDYIEVANNSRCCSECAKYHSRIYSKNGKNGFPNIDIFMDYINNKECDCILTYYPFFYGISEPNICAKTKSVEHSNRPFTDNRTKKEKEEYDAYIKKSIEEVKDRTDYDWICEHLQTIAPKSFGGYRNMKNKNSDNYKKLVQKANEFGYKI